MIFDTVTAFIAEHLHHLDSPKIITKIYANFKVLSEHLAKLKCIEKQSVFEEFVRGMNATQSLFEFVDAGSRPDSTREKVADQFQLDLYDCHCHQVIFGCSSSSHYARLLEETIKDTFVISHITLLEAVPFEKDLAILKDTLKTTNFDNIFRTTKLAAAPAIPKGPLEAVTATLPALSRVESNTTATTGSTSNTPAMTWASLTAQPTPPASKAPSTTRTSTPNSAKSPEPVTRYHQASNEQEHRPKPPRPSHRQGRLLNPQPRDPAHQETQAVQYLLPTGSHLLHHEQLLPLAHISSVQGRTNRSAGGRSYDTLLLQDGLL